MSHLMSRVHTGTSAHRWLQRMLNTFDTNAATIEARVRKYHDREAVPSSSVVDAIATLCDGDDVLVSQMLAGPVNDEIAKDIASTVASTFAKYKGELDPSQRNVAKIVGSKLAADAYDLLSLADKIAITRMLSRDEAKALCLKRIATRRASLELSVASL